MRGLPTILLLLAVSSWTAAVEAGDGRVMLYEATDTPLAQAGHYVLTRDLALAAGDEIRIEANGVILDLNGHEISKAAAVTEVLVRIDTDVQTATIRNGRLSGGGIGISYVGSPMNRGRLRIENVEIRDTAGEGIGLREVELVDVRFCTVINAGGTGISIRGISDDFTGSIVGNTVTSPIGDGIVLFGLRGGEVLDNHVQGHGTAASAVGIWLDGVVAGGGNRIAGNTVVGGGGDDEGMVLDVDSADNLVLRNVISDNGEQGIRALSDRNVMAGNVVRNNGREGIKVTGSRCDVSRNEVTDNGRDGIFVGGDFNLVRDNVSAGNNGFGIRWDTNNNHAYRDNMLLDNTSGGVGGPGGATDAGGNI